MRFRAGILFMGIFWLSAGFPVKAENRQSDLDKIKISVSFLEIHLAEALEAIGEKSNLGITFNDADIRQDKKISYKAINTSAQKILKDVLRGTGLHFRLHGENIIIYKDQEQTIEGKVYDSGIGEPLMGATISIPGTGSGTTSGFNGEFSLQADNFPVKIRIAYLGYETREITVSSPVSDLEIMLVPVNEELKEVVVTALGISREEKSLGYAVGEVSGTSVNESKRMNITNALAGKVAGVQIRNVSSDPGSSSLITIRGASSINGDNQPLFVIDGIPVNSNNQNAESSGEGYVDYGNTSMDISPDDIAEITVLKGAAAALYGSRAANGVILITTKKGRNGKKGLGISYNSAVKIDKA